MHDIMAGMDQKGFFMFVDIPFVPQTQILMVQSIQQTTEFPQLLYVSGGRCPCCAVEQISLSWRRGLSHGPDGSSDHGVSTVCPRQGDRCPCCAGRERSTCAVVEKTVVLPQLHSLWSPSGQLIIALMS